jgi:uncharacterized protein
MKAIRFEWDTAKDLENLAKHGVCFYEAQAAFGDVHRVVVEDLAHSAGEPRYYCMGRVEGGILTVRFTFRPGAIRIIGAGFWRKGKAIYERENPLHR